MKKLLKRIAIGLVVVAAGAGIFSLGGVFGSALSIIKIEASTVNAVNNNKLVYLSGSATPHELTDSMFSITTSGLGLKRVVEMYQLSKDETGKLTNTWSETLLEVSTEDLKNNGIDAPLEFPISSQEWRADKIMLGSLAISPDITKQITTTPEPLPLTEETFHKLNADGQMAFKLHKGSYFFGLDPENPNIGDFRVTFVISPAPVVSIIAKQNNGSLEPYVKGNNTIGILSTGASSFEDLSKDINLGGSFVAKLSIRAGALLVMLIGVFILLGKNPLSRNKASKKENDEMDIEENVEKHIPDDSGEQEIKLDTAVEAENISPDFSSQHPEEDFLSSDNTPSNDFSFDDDISPIELSPVYKTSATAIKSAPENTGTDMNVTSQLKKLGIINPDDHQYIPAPSPVAQKSSSDPTGASEFQSYDTNSYDNSSYVSENNDEMPFEVDVLTEDSLSNELIAANSRHNEADHNQFDEVTVSYPEETAAVAVDDYIDSPELPVIYDETSPQTKQKAKPKVAKPKKDTAATAPLPAPSAPVTKEAEKKETKASPISGDTLPSPDYDNLLSRIVGTTPPTPAPTLPPHPAAAKLPLPPLPPAPLPPAPVAATLPPPPAMPLPPLPAAPLPPAPVAAALPPLPIPPSAPPIAPKAATFDLPGIPDDFDPNAEMPAFDSDEHSPFGIDDPFATTDENN